MLYANRAMAYLKLEVYGKARDDARRAVQCDPKYTKAHSRLATAFALLGETAEAKRSWEAVLQLEPNNTQARAELARLASSKQPQQPQKQPQQQQQKPKSQQQNSSTANQTSASSAGTHPQQLAGLKKPLVRIPIEEVGELTNDAASGKGVDAKTKTAPAFKEAVTERKPSRKDVPSQSTANQPPKPATATAAVMERPAEKSPTPATCVAPATALLDQPAPPLTPQAVAGATEWTPYAFCAAWSSTSGSDSAVADLLQQVEALRLTQLLAPIFDAPVLVSILRALTLHFLPHGKPVVPILRAVAKVR